MDEKSATVTIKKMENPEKQEKQENQDKEKIKELLDQLINDINTRFESDYFNKLFKGNGCDEKMSDSNDPNSFVYYKIPTRIPKEMGVKNNKCACEKIDKSGANSKFENIVYKRNRSSCFQEPHLIYVPPAKRIPKTKVKIEVEIQNLDGLIKLIETYPLDETKEYNINMEGLHKIHSSLIDLNNMIGMKEMKENVVDQILYYIQDLNKSGDFMHTVIYGPPGTGKTEIAKIIGQIFSKLGILKKGVFKKVTRSDLVAGYLGQTAMKTRDVINECLGGVLFIDEAYALGNNEKKDSFSKECIDTLCEALSNHKEDLMVIIAGYEHELKECFFNYNQGLDSRFTWRFKTDEYKGEELHNIFLKKVKEIKWKIDDCDASEQKITNAWFEKNLEYFKFFGRDIETLLAKTKIVHARRVFCKPPEDKMKITAKDLEKGFELYLKNDEVKKRKEVESLKNIIKTMYV
jgi:SpoVK/Ycf46/Vps4 family AAA+-type ATPase